MTVGEERVILSYLEALEKGSLEGILSLFSSGAWVDSPLYGRISAREFYEALLSDTSRSTITVREIFFGASQASAAAHFLYEWVLRDGRSASFECVDIFRFDREGKIAELTIIYDTVTARTLLDKGGHAWNESLSGE